MPKDTEDISASTSKQTVAEQKKDIWQDARFQHLVTDPRFKHLPKKQRKVKIDKRFQSMFSDDKFKVTYTVDKYGRKMNKSNAEDLRKYYELNTSDEEEDEEKEDETASRKDDSESETEEQRAEEKAITDTFKSEENNDLASDAEEIPKTLRERLLDPNIDYARGEGRLLTDSSSDDESSEDEEDDPELFLEHVWGELDVEAERTDESTNRLAVCNMDWDRIRAVDLMVLLSSFLPRGGIIQSVKIYTSEYGKERLKEEELHGPPELVGLGKEDVAKKHDSDDDDDEQDEELVQEQDSDAEQGDDYHMEKLRQYQLNRLRYYYAVVECDSIETADKIYKECDGIEYESSATRVDLRFIPNDTTFDEDEPVDVCTELPDTNSYKPRQFTTTALQQAKVDLTWDETAVERRELGDRLASGKLENVSDIDLRKIVAYSSEEEDEQDEIEEHKSHQSHEASPTQPLKDTTSKPKKKSHSAIDKYKALLAEISEKEQKEKQKKYEMEFSWDVTPTAEASTNEIDTQKTQKPTVALTPIEKALQKRTEKNKKRKQERKKNKLLAQGIDPDKVDMNNSDFDSDVPDGIDMNDPYFAEEFANGEFEAPKSKKKQKQQKLKKNVVDGEEEHQVKELQLLLDDDDLADEGRQHFSLTKILKSEHESKSKKKRRKQLKKSKSNIAGERKEVEDNFEVNVEDDRFKALYTSHLFNIDPTDSHFKKTKGMERIIQEKLKRRHGGEERKQQNGKGNEDVNVELKRPKKRLENTLLIKSLKRKIQTKQQKN